MGLKAYSSGILVALMLSTSQAENITNDTNFYGQSPPVYPSPKGSATGNWAAAYKQAEEFVGKLTAEEKVNLTAGVTVNNGCSGNIAPIERLGFPGFCVSDAGNGLLEQRSSKATRCPYGCRVSQKRCQFVTRPVVGPLGRVAEGGRNWEGFTDDPYLAGGLVYETVQGIQSAGVGASTKHYIANEQETNRNPMTNEQGEWTEAVSSNIDDKTMHELYLWPFQDAVLAGSASVMCSYQRINNSYGCQNSKTLNGLLKTELGFKGYVVTDWGAQHAGIAAANAGLDMVMPSSEMWGDNLTIAIKNGSMEASRLDDMVTRAVEGHVLVKNTNNALPLKSPKLISVFGYDAAPPDFLEVSLAQQNESPPYQNSTLYVGGGSGAGSAAYVDTPIDAIQRQAYEDDTSVMYNFYDQDPDVDASSDVCIVLVNNYATEGFDRPGLSDQYSDKLITNVASKCANTMVVIHNAGIRVVDDWIENSNVSAVIFAHLPGQDTGRSLVDILYGRSNPSGRLPYTVAKKTSDYGDLLSPTQPKGDYWLFPQSDFTEGQFIGYRAFDKKDITPRFEFGYGLSYTIFKYSGLKIQKSNKPTSKYPPSADIMEGGNPHLWDILMTVTAEVQNAGDMDRDEVAQLYLGIPGGPIRQLRGFEKVHIASGQRETVTFSLTRRDLSSWDVNAQQWALQEGEYKIYVGHSSRDLPLSDSLSL
ncbi:hypothetical protein N7450_002115 [Penicillium hetheringtonii]|uniref:Probable beta-glucosidase M n=1 Tax=Penicillium hetheringtonii TaxID=911720 RepID=A0AAD6DWN8_9EURO|nr:hypothetical protein N7450_002115 [Penicillium hetheringtonii]